MEMQRLAKALAAAGVASRRASEELIFAGRVKVNRKVTLLPQTKVDPNKDHITVDEEPIKLEKKRYFLFNKPKGYICANLPDRRTIYRYFAHIPERVYSIGRLDKDTEGLLIMTNDGEFSHKVIHPSSGILKEYIVKTNKEILDDHLKILSAGTTVEGVFVQPKRVEKIRKGTLRIVISEGKKHEVRKLIECANLLTYELRRVRIGGLRLGTLPLGAMRELTDAEKLIIFE